MASPGFLTILNQFSFRFYLKYTCWQHILNPRQNEQLFRHEIQINQKSLVDTQIYKSYFKSCSTITSFQLNVYQTSCLLPIMPISNHAYQKSCLSAIMSVGHQTYRPTCLSANICINHNANQPLCQSTIMTINHQSYL